MSIKLETNVETPKAKQKSFQGKESRTSRKPSQSPELQRQNARLEGMKGRGLTDHVDTMLQ